MRAPYGLVRLGLHACMVLALVMAAPVGLCANDDAAMAGRQIELLGTATEPEIRWRAAERLGQMAIGTDHAVSALVHALGWDMDPAVRGRAAQALGRIGDKNGEAVPALIEALEWDDSLRVRWRAVEALERIGPVTGDVVPALIQVLLTDKFPGVRARAAEAIGTNCPATDVAIAALTETVVADDHPGARWQAAAALEKCAVVLKNAGAAGAVESLKQAQSALSAQNDPELQAKSAAVRLIVRDLEKDTKQD